ncbi:energy transducer TonB [Novosphingobium sp. TH158]|nr:energy transducer TonB [Novosphingobium sp. TH158]
MLAVALLQASAIYAIIAGLSFVVNPPERKENPTTFTVPPPSPSPTEVQRERKTPPADAPQSRGPAVQPTVAPSPLPSASNSTSGAPADGPGTATAGPSPLPTSEPSRAALAVKGPAPRGRPGEWVTRNDYPSQDLREGNEGLVRFRLGVGADGRVTSCTITASSGFPGLDAAACARLTQRARFNPATDEAGARVAGAYYGMLRWKITN